MPRCSIRLLRLDLWNGLHIKFHKSVGAVGIHSSRKIHWKTSTIHTIVSCKRLYKKELTWNGSLESWSDIAKNLTPSICFSFRLSPATRSLINVQFLYLLLSVSNILTKVAAIVKVCIPTYHIRIWFSALD